MCGARRNSEKSWSTCTRIRWRESWCNIRKTGLGAVGRTTRGRERVEFELIQTEEGTWKQQVRGRVKTRTLNTEGCGTPESQNQLPKLRHPPRVAPQYVAKLNEAPPPHEEEQEKESNPIKHSSFGCGEKCIEPF